MSFVLLKKKARKEMEDIFFFSSLFFLFRMCDSLPIERIRSRMINIMERFKQVTKRNSLIETTCAINKVVNALMAKLNDLMKGFNLSQRNKDIIELCLKVSLQSLIDKNPTGKWIKCLKEFAFGFLTLFSKYSNYKFAKIITAIIMLVWAFAAFPTTFTVESFSSYALKFEGVFAELIREKMAQIIAYLLEIFRNFFQKFTKHTPSAPYARHMIGN
ncbi:hypothetical protein SSS_08118 [Sarcoptes scabiei]|nr:hypothetical protein SSS_08118 [Sarcoptes scabiei]